MTTDQITKIVSRIIENGRAADNNELRNEFEFDAAEMGFTEAEIQEAMSGDWFPWISGIKA